MLFGASYYHEYQPYERLEEDLDLMVEANFTVIRVGESTWASYEPRNGQIAFDALAEVIDQAHARGLKVIAGTPTYAVPPWLAREHPEIMAHTATAQALPYGARQNVDFTHPAFRYHAERLLRRMAETLAEHPAVIGFQVDNEIGVHHLYNPHVFERFRRHVFDTLGGVDEVNRRWGLTYWSHRLTDEADLWRPDGNTNPGYALEWDRFQGMLTVEFVSWQRDLLRPLLREDQFITHDLVGGQSLRSTDIRGVAEAMDRTSVNIYYAMQEALTLPEPDAEEIRKLGPTWVEDAGVWSLLWRADMAYGARGPSGERFMVTEAQAASIGGQETMTPPYPGQLRLAGHLLAARGADMLAYWHWHTLHYGFETYWGGLLGHDLERNRLYREATALGADLKQLTPHLEETRPDADLAILFSRDSQKALATSPMLVREGTNEPDHNSYHRVFSRCYQGATDARAQVRVVHPDSDWTQHLVLVVPALYVADDALLNRLVAAAEAGIHVLMTFRSGYVDEWVRARWARQPGVLRQGVGASYQESMTLRTPVQLRSRKLEDAPTLSLPPNATANGWADCLVVDEAPCGQAEVVAEYEHPFLKSFPAVTTRSVGAGRMTWIGTLPDRDTMRRIMAWAVEERGSSTLASRWQDLPDSVAVQSSMRLDGTRLWFLTNHSWNPTTITPPAPMQTLIAPSSTEPAQSQRPQTVELAAWDSCVLLENVP
jgi:beta-galactosidase